MSTIIIAKMLHAHVEFTDKSFSIQLTGNKSGW